mmetsp:Transcript_10514/g.9056  ORF Transcript_10514/g.9056 Transcript_10514/m.9056 type:complete len:140 (-) Transcript_10514:102-521(-)
MRLAPPVVTSTERVAVTDHEVAGIKIKKGTFMAVCHVANLLDDRFFENAASFDPERWVRDFTTAKTMKEHPSVYIPFAMGARQCIGQRFAMNEARVVLTAFLRMYDYKLADDDYKIEFTQRFLREPVDPIVYKMEVKSK